MQDKIEKNKIGRLSIHQSTACSKATMWCYQRQDRRNTGRDAEPGNKAVETQTDKDNRMKESRQCGKQLEINTLSVKKKI